jgi:hypothetical protein
MFSMHCFRAIHVPYAVNPTTYNNDIRALPTYVKTDNGDSDLVSYELELRRHARLDNMIRLVSVFNRLDERTV